MKRKNYLFFLLLLFVAGCNSNKNEEHDNEVKLKITAYNSSYELFAEADPFVIGETSNILTHFSHLPDFKALEKGSVSVNLIAGGREVKQTLKEPTRKGIFSFDIIPVVSGKAKLVFAISTDKDSSQIVVENLEVFSKKDAADESAKKLLPSNTNTVVFTKEQSWKIDFETGFPLYESFGPIIRTTALVKSALNDETVIAARADGMIVFPGGEITEGINVAAGQNLFSISAIGLSDRNSAIRFAESQNNYKKAKADYDRVKELSEDKIVSEKELQNALNEYENATVIYNAYSKNFSSGGQSVVSPMSGFIKHLSITNGQFVEAGQHLVTITKNKTLLLQADVQLKYAPYLSQIFDANIRTLHDNKTYTLNELNGKILSYGKSTSDDNFLVPISLQIDNIGNFIGGGFVELFLKAQSAAKTVTIPIEAILEEQGVYFVFVQINPELFEKREVKIGATDGKKTEVLSGLKKDERVVTKGAIMVKLAQASNALDPHSGHNH